MLTSRSLSLGSAKPSGADAAMYTLPGPGGTRSEYVPSFPVDDDNAAPPLRGRAGPYTPIGKSAIGSPLAFAVTLPRSITPRINVNSMPSRVCPPWSFTFSFATAVQSSFNSLPSRTSTLYAPPPRRAMRNFPSASVSVWPHCPPPSVPCALTSIPAAGLPSGKLTRPLNVAARPRRIVPAGDSADPPSDTTSRYVACAKRSSRTSTSSDDFCGSRSNVTRPAPSVFFASAAPSSAGNRTDHQSSIIGELPWPWHCAGATSTPAAGLPDGSSNVTATCAGGCTPMSTGRSSPAGKSSTTDSRVYAHGGASTSSPLTCVSSDHSMRKLPSSPLRVIGPTVSEPSSSYVTNITFAPANG